MNTPAHVVLNAVVLGRGEGRKHWIPIVGGALVPDAPMFGFYALQRVVRGRPEHVIWTETYYQPAWQAFFDVFNSLPLIALGVLIAWRLRRPGWLAFFLSMGLHCLADLPLHHDDGHAHFFPLTNWQFQSPVSYWDPRHFGHWFSVLETMLVLGGSCLLIGRRAPRAWPILGGAALFVYAGFWLYAWAVWIR